MSFEIFFTFTTILLSLGFLAFSRIGAEIIMMAALSLLLLSGILNSKEALSGFSNEGMMTVAVLYIVVAGLRDTGAIMWLSKYILGHPRSIAGAQLRMMPAVAGLSAFLNNTPIVAMMIPAVADWTKKQHFSASKLMIPLSYAAILGGTCSLIGTSTNLVVSGLIISQTDLSPLKMFDIAWVGVPCTLIGISFVIMTSRWLLPKRKAVLNSIDDPRKYYSEMMVEENGPLAGKTIDQAGLRHLPDAFLAEIERKGRILAAISPREMLQGSDILRFVGVVDSMVELRKIRGLQPATNQVNKLETPENQRTLIEAVVSDSCPLVGKSIREGAFRSYYHAVVIAVSRNGQKLRQKIGDIVLKPGDILLIEALPDFVNQQRNSRDFYLVSLLEHSSPPRYSRAPLALGILALMVILASFGILSMFQAALLAAGLMLLSRCLDIRGILENIEWPVLIVIAASFGIGRALELTGGAELVAKSLIGLANNHPWLSLFILYGITTLFTELITNNAAAVLTFPIAYATAQSLGVNFMPFAIVIMMAASASFSTPIGYQTNLMVMGPGGYRFGDYLRIGLPLNLIIWLVTATLAPLIWPF